MFVNAPEPVRFHFECGACVVVHMLSVHVWGQYTCSAVNNFMYGFIIEMSTFMMIQNHLSNHSNYLNALHAVLLCS